MRTLALSLIFFAFCQFAWAAGSSVTLIKDGKARCAIYVPAEVMAPDVKEALAEGSGDKYDAENARIRLRESVKDLSLYLGKMSGASVPINIRKPSAKDGGVAILVGSYAKEMFGAPKKSSPYKQGWRLAVTPKSVGLIGESDEATSYAIYEVLDRLGCRWYMPSDMGEVIPSLSTITLQVGDTSSVPQVISRRIWYADDAFRRRNRLGGLWLECSHALEIKDYVTKEQLEAHPDWNAEMGGKRSINGRHCWANEELANAIADNIIARLDKHYVTSTSLAPADGASFCECEKCKALDAGDWDPTLGCVSITDRYIHFVNIIAERVTKKYPDELFGILAYVQYTRPPVREKLHKNIVPVFAPITYCRAHAMTDETCASRHQMLKLVEGWGKAVKHYSLYEFAYNLAEVTAPNPMITKWSTELPIFYKNHLDLWTPETMPNFDNVLPGLYLGIRLSWNPNLDPKGTIDEFYTKFYGSAAKPMRKYWETFDTAWTKTPEHAGEAYGYNRIFTKKVMADGRAAIDEALSASKTAMEYRRVKLAEDSLKVFEGYMDLRNRLLDGEFLPSNTRKYSLLEDWDHWGGYLFSKATDYKENYSFSGGIFPDPVGKYYVEIFQGAAFRDATRVANNFLPITGTINNWKYQQDEKKVGESAGWQSATYDDSAWKTMDVKMDTWADLGFPDYLGTVWYRTTVAIPSIPDGKKVYLWLSSFDSICKLYINGQLVPYVEETNEKQLPWLINKDDVFQQYIPAKPVLNVDEKGVPTGECTAWDTPVSFNVSSAIKPGEQNQVTLILTRPGVNEIGIGGLQGPVMFYREKD